MLKPTVVLIMNSLNRGPLQVGGYHEEATNHNILIHSYK